jgi:PTH1 family peptidyl-tRNA hydrolase
MQLIVGLGNPGNKYAPTRHNVGAWFVEALAQQYKAQWQLATKFHSRITEIHFAEETIRLAIPTTYMNLSGQAVGAIAHFYKIPPTEILVAHDELDLSAGIIRLKQDGGHGGHNGLRSIMDNLHSQAFYRLRIGIGRPPRGDDVADFVLSKPSSEELITIEQSIANALTHMDLILANNIGKAMQVLHT